MQSWSIIDFAICDGKLEPNFTWFSTLEKDTYKFNLDAYCKCTNNLDFCNVFQIECYVFVT